MNVITQGIQLMRFKLMTHSQDREAGARHPQGLAQD